MTSETNLTVNVSHRLNTHQEQTINSQGISGRICQKQERVAHVSTIKYKDKENGLPGAIRKAMQKLTRNSSSGLCSFLVMQVTVGLLGPGNTKKR